MSNFELEIKNLINEDQKIKVAKLYYAAFDKKISALWIFSKNEKQAVDVLRECINYEKGLYAVNKNNVLGFIGLEIGNAYFVNLKFSVLSNVFGFLGATWRFLLYGIYRLFHNYQLKNEVHIDPIVVSSESRGMGIGTKLLDATFDFARSINRKNIVLEVVDTNPEAKKLYERIGFSITKIQNTRIFTSNAGFSKVILMKKVLDI